MRCGFGAKCPTLTIEQGPGGFTTDLPVPDNFLTDHRRMEGVVFHLIEIIRLLNDQVFLITCDSFAQYSTAHFGESWIWYRGDIGIIGGDKV